MTSSSNQSAEGGHSASPPPEGRGRRRDPPLSVCVSIASEVVQPGTFACSRREAVLVAQLVEHQTVLLLEIRLSLSVAVLGAQLVEHQTVLLLEIRLSVVRV